MKLKIALTAAVIGLSSQASFAATETSCNPFSASWNCSAVANASSYSMVSKMFSTLSSSATSAAPTKRTSVGSARMGRTLSQMIRSMRAQVVVLDTDGDTDGFSDTPVAVVTPGSDDVSSVPVPAAGFLLLAGLGGLAMMRRKKS